MTASLFAHSSPLGHPFRGYCPLSWMSVKSGQDQWWEGLHPVAWRGLTPPAPPLLWPQGPGLQRRQTRLKVSRSFSMGVHRDSEAKQSSMPGAPPQLERLA